LLSATLLQGYSNIFVSSPHPENLKTFFEFVFQGFDALAYKEHQDYDLLTSTEDAYAGCVVRVNVHHTHRQTIQVRRCLSLPLLWEQQPASASAPSNCSPPLSLSLGQYVHPSEGGKLGHAELVVVDEAAAIPLPMVRSMFGPHLMFLSSTINGYEGTGRQVLDSTRCNVVLWA
jgi:N-acetyltransferase 10